MYIFLECEKWLLKYKRNVMIKFCVKKGDNNVIDYRFKLSLL